MPRPLRLQLPDAFYHVMNRGLAKKDIFYNDKSREIFLEILADACEKFGISVHAYCLMSNHYHLLVQTPNGNLAKFMQHLSGIYTRRYNKFMGIDGPLFRGRFKSVLVSKDSYLLNLSRYIHRNPINFVNNLRSYKWSSYPAYLGLAYCPSWLNKNESLEIMSINSIETYESFVMSEQDSEEIDIINKQIIKFTKGV